MLYRTSLTSNIFHFINSFFFSLTPPNSYTAVIRRRQSNFAAFLHTFPQPGTAHAQAASSKLGITSAEPSWLQLSHFTSLTAKSCFWSSATITASSLRGATRSTEKIKQQQNNICSWSLSERFCPNRRPELWETRHNRNIDCSNSKRQKITTSIFAASCELRLHLTRGNSLKCVQEVLLMRFRHSEGRIHFTETLHTDSSYQRSSSRRRTALFVSHSN